MYYIYVPCIPYTNYAAQNDIGDCSCGHLICDVLRHAHLCPEGREVDVVVQGCCDDVQGRVVRVVAAASRRGLSHHLFGMFTHVQKSLNGQTGFRVKPSAHICKGLNPSSI